MSCRSHPRELPLDGGHLHVGDAEAAWDLRVVPEWLQAEQGLAVGQGVRIVVN